MKNKIYLILNFSLYICEFAHLPKSIGDTKVNACGAFVVICQHAQRAEKFESSKSVFSQLRLHKATFCHHDAPLIPWTSARFAVYLVSCFVHLCACYWWFYSLKCCPPHTKYNAEVFASVPKLKKAVVCLMEKNPC